MAENALTSPLAVVSIGGNSLHVIQLVFFFLICIDFVCAPLCVESKDELKDSILSSYLVDPGSNSGLQAWWQVTSPDEPSC